MLEHRLAKLAAAAAFVLLVIGGTVNPTGSSLACPEPTLVCHGQLFPPMVGGVLYEHGHRLAAMTVGLLQIALTFVLLRRGRKRLGWILLGLVIAQGALGAITVGYKLPWFVSTGHLLLGMSYFAALIYTAFHTRPEPTAAEVERSETGGGDRGIERSETGGGDPGGSADGAGGRAPRGIDGPAAGHQAEVWFGDACYARIATLAADGSVVDGPHPIPACASPVIGRAFPAALRDALAELVADAVPAPLAADARALCAAAGVAWADLGARAAAERPGGFAVHAALWDRIAPLGLARLALALAESLAPVVAAAVVRRAAAITAPA